MLQPASHAIPKAVSLGFGCFRTCAQPPPLPFQNLEQQHVKADQTKLTNPTTQPKRPRCRRRQLLRQRPLASRLGQFPTRPRRRRNGTRLRMRPSLARYVDARTFEADIWCCGVAGERRGWRNCQFGFGLVGVGNMFGAPIYERITGSGEEPTGILSKRKGRNCGGQICWASGFGCAPDSNSAFSGPQGRPPLDAAQLASARYCSDPPRWSVPRQARRPSQDSRPGRPARYWAL